MPRLQIHIFLVLAIILARLQKPKLKTTFSTNLALVFSFELRKYALDHKFCAVSTCAVTVRVRK